MKKTTHNLVYLTLMGTIIVLTNACPTFKTALENKIRCAGNCINMGDSSVWGTFEYSEDSLVCMSAVHAGVLSHDGGWVNFKPVSGRVQRFIASIRNRVISKARSSEGEGYTFIKENATNEQVVISDELMVVHNSYNLQDGEYYYLRLCCISSKRDIQKENLVNWKFQQLDNDDIAISKGSNGKMRGNTENELAFRNRRAVRCLSSMPQYDVTAVIQAPHGLYLAPSSSMTVNTGGNKTINIKETAANEDSSNIYLRRLPMSWPYNNDDLASQSNQIYIESAGPGDSGIYIAGNSEEKNGWSQSKRQVEHEGAYFRLIVRDCGSDHWGLDCGELCPECHHGGLCHPNTGVCICPPGYYGAFCQHACDANKFGSDCNFGCEEKTLGFPAEQGCKGLTFCLPDPYGCSCAPGFTGSLCNQECSGQKFGPNCALSCDYCTGGCDAITGACFDSCTEGILCLDNLPLMLPYLAQPPILSNISSNAAALSFHSWIPLSDGGLQQTPILNYLVQMRQHHLDPWVQEASRHDGGTVILAEMLPGQEYHVRVVIATAAGMEQGDTSHRRVQEAIFTTLCLDQARADLLVSNISQTSVILSWLPVEENQESCKTQYKVNIIDGLDGSNVAEVTTLNSTIEVNNLLPDYDYIAYLSIDNILGPLAVSTNITFRSLPLAPGPPILTFLQMENNQFLLTWNLPSNSSAAEHYDVNYKVISYGGCNDTFYNSTFFKMSTNETKLVFSDLEPYSNYIFCVVASNKGGIGPLICEESYTPPIKGPSLSITEFSCRSTRYYNYCYANYSGDCHEVNGPGLRAQLDLETFVDFSKSNSSIQFTSIPVNGSIEFNLQNVSSLLSGASYNATLTLYNNVSSGSKATTELATAEQVPGQVSSLHGEAFHRNYSHWVQLYLKLPCPMIGPPTALQVLYLDENVSVSLEERCDQKYYDMCPTVHNLLADNLYNFSVRLGNSEGWGNSSFVTIRTLQSPPWPPVNLTAKEISPGIVKVSWEVDREGSQPQYYYMLYKFQQYAGCEKHNIDRQSHHLTLNSTQVILDQLEAYAVYNICLQAKGLTGDSAFTCQQYVTQAQRGPTLDIEEFHCIPDYYNKARCSARILGSCQDINGPQLEAHLHIEGSFNCSAETISTNVILTLKEMFLDFLTDTSLAPGIEYKAKLSLSNEFDEGTSSMSYFMTKASKPPPVVNATVISISSAGAVLQWSAPCPNHGRIIRYYINDKPLAYIQTCENITANTYCYKVKGIKPGMQYRFKIEAENLAGKSDANFISFTTDLEYPSAPVSVKTNRGLEWLDISIGLPEKPGGPLINCTIKVIQQNHTCTADVNYRDVDAGYITCNISGLDAGTKYLTSEFCCNAKGCGEELNTTLATLPTKPKVMGNIGLQETTRSIIKLTLPYIESKEDEKSYAAVIVQDISNGEDITTSKLSEVYNKLRHDKEKQRNSFSNMSDVEFIPNNDVILSKDKNNDKSISTTSNGSKEINTEDGQVKKDIFISSNEEKIFSANDMANEGFIYVDQITDHYDNSYEDKRVSSSSFSNELDGSGESYLNSGDSYFGSGEMPHLFTDVHPFGSVGQHIQVTTVSTFDGNGDFFSIINEKDVEKNMAESETDSVSIKITEIYTKMTEIMELHENTTTIAFLTDTVKSNGESNDEQYISECNGNVYIAGILFKGQEEFKVGDGKIYGGYYNCPIQPGHKYRLGFVAVTHLNGEEEYSERTLGSAVLAEDQDVWQKVLSDIQYGLQTLGSLIQRALQSHFGVICFIVAIMLLIFGYIIPAVFCGTLIAAPVFFINRTSRDLHEQSRELGDGKCMDPNPSEDIPMADMNQEKE